jgi:DNA-binding transcriptional MerR regulator/predicted transcriptional regulator YdeE
VLSIGEFSKVTGLTVKALRFYHEEGILIPRYVDRETGYRSYDEGQIEMARLIAHLRSLEFPLAEIKAIFASQDDEEALAELFARQKAMLEERLRHYQSVKRSLDQFLAAERQVREMSDSIGTVIEKRAPKLLAAGIRTKGKYSECGKLFGKLFRVFGWSAAGPPFLLLYDSEYKENDADYEACVPIRKSRSAEGVSIHELPEARCMTIVHKGPYDQIGLTYAKVLAEIKAKKLSPHLPSREVYLKGPGMLFRGNPKNYLTEIQIPVSG